MPVALNGVFIWDVILKCSHFSHFYILTQLMAFGHPLAVVLLLINCSVIRCHEHSTRFLPFFLPSHGGNVRRRAAWKGTNSAGWMNYGPSCPPALLDCTVHKKNKEQGIQAQSNQARPLQRVNVPDRGSQEGVLRNTEEGTRGKEWLKPSSSVIISFLMKAQIN